MSFDPDNTCLDKAKKLVMGDRQGDYGHPLDDFSKVTGAAKALGIDPASGGPLHHSLYMVLVKIARLIESPDHADSIVDGPGYFLTYERVLAEQERRKEARINKIFEARADPIDDPVEWSVWPDPYVSRDDVATDLADQADEKMETLRHLYRVNPVRFMAEIGLLLTPEQRARVKQG